MTVTPAKDAGLTGPIPRRRPRRAQVARAILGAWEGRVGTALVLFLVALALVGPFIAPHDPAATVGPPFQLPTAEAWLGTDKLGRDVLTRFLHGGATLLGVAVLSTLLCYPIGVIIGMLAAYLRGATDLSVVWVADVLLSIPAIVLALVIVSGLGPGVGPLIIAVAVVQLPQIIRLVRTLTIEVAANPYVEAAQARGASTLYVATREIFPNIRATLLADMALRVSFAIILFSSLSFLGFGQQPPASEWGLMIAENSAGLVSQPLTVAVPAIAIALLTVGINFLADSIARTLGKSTESPRV